MMHVALIMLGATTTDEVRLTGAGAAIMTVSIVFVLGLMTFCMSRILREQHPKQHLHAPLDIDTHDRET